MLCDPATNPLEILSCEGEDRNNGTGDNNPSNGAFMTWTATGSNNLYYSRIYNGLDTFQIVQAGTQNSVYQPDGDGNYTGTLAIGGNTTNACLEPGTWTVQVWDVIDLDGNLQPDRDANGNIIGCFRECTYTFLPSCPTGQPFDVDVSNVGCTVVDGSINLINFDPNDVYCDGQATFSWTGPNGFSSSSQNISGLEVGTYTFQLTDFYGCTTGPITVDVTTAPPVEIICGNPTAPSVFEASDGSFEVDITVGEGDYTIEWAGPATGSTPGVDGINTISGLPAGTYDVLVTDNETGCTAPCTVTIPDPPCEVAFDVSLDNIGNIILTMTGGRPNFFVSFSGTATASQDDLGPYSTSPITLSANLFEPGEYIFTVYEADRPDCSAFEIFIIEGPDCSTFEFTLENLTEISCGGTDDGAIDISLSGGVNPTLTWVSGPGVSGSTNQNITNLGPGTYYFQAIDEQGCFLEETYELTAPPPLQVVCSAEGETCEDADDGSISLNVSGGTGPYSLSYTALDTDGIPLPPVSNIAIMDGDSLLNLVPGEYAVQIEDTNGCIANCTTTVEEVVCPNIPIGGSDQTVQLDSIINATQLNGTGGIILSFGGAPDWTYFISSTTTGFDTTVTTSVAPDTTLALPIDTYRLTLIRAIDTIMIDSMLLDSLNISACCISQGTAPTFDFIVRGPECTLVATPTVQNPACFGEASGSINLNISGANGGITVAWDSTFLSGSSPGGIPAGTYTATITDDAGCEVVQMVELFPPPPIQVTLQSDTIACAGDSTGQITANVTDAQGNVSFQWSPGGPNTATLTGIPIGDYAVIVTDTAGCSDDASISVTEVPALDLSCGAIAESNVGAADGKIGFSISGGTPAYSLLLNGSPITRPAQDTFRNLAPGSYTIEITDANGCMTSCTAVINPGGCGAFTLTLSLTQPDCDNASGEATVTPVSANGMVTYQWAHGPTSASLTNLAPGNYSVTATDAFACTSIQEFTVNAFTDFPGLTVDTFPIICSNDCAEINYVLSGPAPVTYFFTLNQAGTQVQGQVTESRGPGTLTLCPTDFGFVDFANTTVTFDSVTAANGCSRLINAARDISLFPASAGSISPTICATDTFFLAGEAFHADRISGNVVLPNASANGCDSTVAVSLNFFAPATAALNPVVCATDTFSLGGEIFHAGRTAGDVRLENAASNGCDSIITVNLDFYPQLTGIFDTTICTGTSFTYGGQLFTEAVDDQLVTLPITTANGCDSLVSVTVRERAVPSVSISGDGIICSDGLLNISITYDGPAEANVELSSNPGEIISLVSGTTTIQRPVPAGTEVTIVNAEDGGPCPLVTSGSITVSESDLGVRIDITSGDGVYAVSCAGGDDGQVMAIPTGGLAPFSYDWNTGYDTQMIGELEAGDYSLIITSGRGCQASASVRLTSPDTLAVQLREVPATCINPTPALVIQNIGGGVGPYVYSANGGNSFFPVVNFPDTLMAQIGSTTFTLEDSKGCTLNQEFDFAPAPTGDIVVTPDFSVITLGDSVEITVLTDLNATGYQLTPGPDSLFTEPSFFVTPDTTTRYQVTAIDDAGCIVSGESLVVVDRFIPVYAPSAFSPNQDGNNDLYRIYGRRNVASFSNFSIFDRWGNRIFDFPGPVSPRDENWGWDGRATDGKLRQSGVYVFTVTVTFTDGRTKEVKGDLVLVR